MVVTGVPSASRPDALRRAGLLDAQAEPAFDRITRVAATMLRTPIALVTLIDDDRQYVKSGFGLGEGDVAGSELPRSHSFCRYAIDSGLPLIVNDVRLHPVLRSNPAIETLGVVAYAGVPLLSADGPPLGTLCVLDRAAREWTEQDALLLADLAATVTTEIALRLELVDRVRAERDVAAALASADNERRRLSTVLNALPVGVWLSDAEGRVTDCNPAAATILAGDSADMAGVERYVRARASLPDAGAPLTAEARVLANAVRLGQTSIADAVDLERFDGSRVHVLTSAAPIRDGSGVVAGAVAVMLDVTPQHEAMRERDRLRAALDGERRRLGDLFEQAPAFIAWSSGPSHVFEGANQAYLQLVGLRDIIGKTVAEALPEVAEQGLIQMLDRVLETGEPFVADGMRLLLCRTSGAEPEERYANFVYQPLVDADGARTGIFCHGVDVTAQVRAAMSLRESEERHRDVLDSLPVLVYRAGMESPYRATFVNRAVELLGYTQAEWLAHGDLWRSRIHPDDRDRVLAEVGAAFSHGRAGIVSYRWLAKDGSVHWIQDRCEFVLDGDATSCAWQGIMLDITAQRAAEEALRHSEERFRLAGQATREVIRDWDISARSLFWSDALAATFGIAPAPSLREVEWWYSQIHPDDAGRIRASVVSALAGDATTWSHEYRFRRGDGSYAHVLDRGIIARDESGRAARMVGSMLDLTDRNEAAEAIRFQAHLLDTVEQAVIAADLDGRVTYWNAFAERLYGFTSAEVMGQSVFELAIVSDAEESVDQVRSLASRSESWSGEYARRRKDGSVFTALVTNSPIRDPQGGVVGIVGVSLDATERRFLEEQLRQSQKMEAVGRLAGGIAHDFNNLLTVIKASTGFLLEELDAVDPRREDVEQIGQASERAAGLTRQLLAFSRKQMLDPRVLEFNVVVQNLLPMLGRIIGEDIAVDTRLAADVGSVMADVGQIEQVLVNLVVNARDAMPEGGRILIETANVTLDGMYAAGYAEREHSVVLPGEYVMIALSDTGMGMSPEVRARAFEPFYTTKETGKGTGLGLSTVYGIIKQSGGHVWAYSEPGEGTVFKLYFPRIAAPAVTRLQHAALDRPVRGTETVLLAEDEDQLRVLARRVLVRQGYTVLESRNGREALEMATKYEGQIHLVITDVVMPEMSGRGLVERLRAVRPHAAVIYMSGYTDDDVLRRGMLAPGSRFVQKPFAPADLLRVVREVLDQRA